MRNNAKAKFRNTKLQVAFVVLILFTIGIGTISILQIQGLGQRVEDLGRRNLILNKAVLEMRINNTIFAMGIRNYIFWRVSKYLGAVSMAINLDDILKTADNFKEQLNIYQKYSYLTDQKRWAEQVGSSFDELSKLGRQIVGLVESTRAEKLEGAISGVLMAFENRLYKIDEFLGNTMGKENLDEIERQLNQTNLNKQRAITFLIVILCCTVIVGILVATFVYRTLRQERILREGLYYRMINMEESERKNLSNAVHDQMGQDLSALKIYLGIIEQNLTSSKPLPGRQAGALELTGDSKPALELSGVSSEVKEKLEGAREIVSGLIEKSHNIAFLLRPPDLDEVGLVGSLESLILDYKRLSKINYVYNMPKENLILSSEHSLIIYRITQELLTNMIKHSDAKNVEITLNKHNHTLEFSYRDDGKGFDYNAALRHPRRRREDKLGIGILSLKERVGLLNGKMQIDTAPGKGTRVAVELPI
ncbi:MAG: hypothetical protein KJ923_00400 [Candidatus Omnitrophica bacterium]|nr:hypothetical protein [Candidatus Omnitrophota bacterium]